MLWAAAEAERLRLGAIAAPETRPYVEKHLEPLRVRRDFEEAWREGAELRPDEAIARGLRASVAA